jgi:hypothetical protein
VGSCRSITLLDARVAEVYDARPAFLLSAEVDEELESLLDEVSRVCCVSLFDAISLLRAQGQKGMWVMQVQVRNDHGTTVVTPHPQVIAGLSNGCRAE